MLPNASEFLAINANLLKIAFGRAFAREIRYMGEQYKLCTIIGVCGQFSFCIFRSYQVKYFFMFISTANLLPGV